MRREPRPQIARQLYQIPQRLHRLLGTPRAQQRVHGREVQRQLALGIDRDRELVAVVLQPGLPQ